MTRFFYDWEFWDNGRTIEPLSLGMCADASDETLYLVRRFDPEGDLLLEAVREHPWLSQHVVPELVRANRAGEAVCLSEFAPAVLDYMCRVAGSVHGPDVTRKDVELWGYFSAYDHVCLAQLFGTMSKLPEPVPMFTCDLKQEMVRWGIGRNLLPDNPDAHNALADARWNRDAYRVITQHIMRML